VTLFLVLKQFFFLHTGDTEQIQTFVISALMALYFLENAV
jgi:hypothetical protein